MRTVLRWALSFLIGLAALVGLIAFLNSRDQSGVDQAIAGPGEPYKGTPALSASLKDALRLGNVVVLYRDAKPPPGTRALVPPGGKALAQAGQAVLLERVPALGAPLAAVSAKAIERADAPRALQPFVDYWLGGR